ncbi:MAG: Sodium/glucose cotransporter [Elusimicrobia bacterium]|nr:Sodium/glucose cotransporter [Elusimicrobiota bacterium]
MTWFGGPSYLTMVDYGVLSVSIAVLFAIGFWMGREENSTQAFFLGNRKIPMWAACLSFVATEISAVTIISVPATAYKENWQYLQFFIGSFGSRIALAFFFIPAFYKFNCTTIYEFLKHRFGAETQYAATGFFFVTRLLGSGVRLTVAAKAVSVLLGWNLVPTLLVFSIAAMLYISWGGVKAVIWTGAWQAFLFIVAGSATLVFLSSAIEGGFFGIFKAARLAGKLDVMNWGPNVSDPQFFKTIFSDPNIWWLAILNGFFGSMAAYGTDHELMQRLLTLETRQKSQKTTLATPLVGLLVLLIHLVIGAGLFVFYQQHTGASLPAKLDDVFPHFANFEMPALLRGLVLSAVVMASIDSPLGSLTASFVTDFYKPLIRKGATDQHYLRVARVMVLVFGVVLGVLAYSFSALSGFLWLAFKIGGVTFGSLLGVFLLGLLTQVKSNKANIVAMVTMAAINAVLLFLTEKGIVIVGWTWLVLIGTFGTMALARLLAPVMDRDNER